MSKTLFITVYDGDIEKNFLRSGILAILQKQPDLQIVLLVRAPKDSVKHKYYVEHFANENVIIEPLPHAMTRFEEYLYHLSWNSLPTRSAYVKRHDLYVKNKKRLRYLAESLAGLLGHSRLWRKLLRFAYFWLPDDYGKELFDKYQPDLLFAPTMFSAEDCRLLRYARKHTIPTLTVAKSWDVPTTRGFTRVQADKILVFNEINKQEIIDIGDYKPEQVEVIGFPQFDYYLDKNVYVSREEFFEHIGADLEKRLLLFAVPGDFKNPFSHEILQMLDDAIEQGKFIKPIQVLARFHPKYASRAEQLDGLKHIIHDRPGTYFTKDMEKAIDAPMSTTFQWTFTDNDLAHLANSLHHSDVTINTESTMTLDAGAHDKPVVLIGFDGKQKLDYWQAIIRNYGREHLSAVLETEGARLAHSMDELIQYVNMYLEDPEVDAGGRALLRERLLYRCDGQSAQRVADNILTMLKLTDV